MVQIIWIIWYEFVFYSLILLATIYGSNVLQKGHFQIKI